MPNPGPRGLPQGPRPQRRTTPRRPPAVHPGVVPRPWAWGGREGPRTPMNPTRTPVRAIAAGAVPSSLTVQGSANSCLKLFTVKGSAATFALSPICPLKKYIKVKSTPSFHP